MKHFSTFVSMFLLLLMGGVQTATAQDDSDWENYARDPESIGENDYVYLYNVTQNQFLNSGGDYGMQGILNPRGIRLALESETVVSGGSPWRPTYTTYYYLKGPIVNDAQGSYLARHNDNNLGDVIYIDRDRAKEEDDAKFTIETIGGGNTFRINTGGRSAYWTYDTSKNYVTVTSRELDADVWCFISIEDYRTFTQVQAQVGDYNVSGLLYNTRFIRNVSDPNNRFWATDGLDYYSDDYCTAIDSRLGTNPSDAGNNDNYAREYGSYGCLEIGSDQGRFYQEVRELNPGLYKVSAQAFFDGNDSAPYTNGAYGKPNTASETNAYLFANGSREPIPMLTDEQYSEFISLVKAHHDLLEEGQSSEETGGISNKELFRRNVPASVYMTGDDTYSPDESRFVVEVYVMVEDGTLRLGVGKGAEGGRVYMDNMTLTYMGNPQTKQYGFGVDAYGYQRDVDPYTYTKDGYMFYLSRKFVASTDGNGWNSLTLPVNLRPSQLRGAFGDDMELVKLVGVNTKNPQQILFEPVDLDGGDGLEAGQCYLVKVTKDPIAKANTSFEFNRIDERQGDGAYADVPR